MMDLYYGYDVAYNALNIIYYNNSAEKIQIKSRRYMQIPHTSMMPLFPEVISSQLLN